MKVLSTQTDKKPPYNPYAVVVVVKQKIDMDKYPLLFKKADAEEESHEDDKESI